MFPVVSRTFTVELVKRFGEWNNDNNMLHYDDDAAREAGFPHPIIHSPLSASLISEAARDLFGTAWVCGGILTLRFLRPVYVGETVTTGGTFKSLDRSGDEPRAVYEVWAAKPNGEKVIVGEASAARPAVA
jgi:3-hydroxybutyryl-CoA dehydratase